MSWFRKKFNNWVHQAWADARDTTDATDAFDVLAKSAVSMHPSLGTTSIRFTIYPASGGHVIEYYKQERYKEGDGPQLTIVNNGDSLGTAIEHILTLEALKA